MSLLTRTSDNPDQSGVDTSRPWATYRQDAITTALGAWFAVGLFLDAWAHNNLSGLESFFTPWHGVFYSGFMATAGWVCWIVLKGLQAGRRAMAAVPVGYGLALLGLPIFALSGMGDALWHVVWGVETNEDILFSPTHLGLVTSMVLILTAPLRSAWSDLGTGRAPGLRRLLPAVVSTAFATAIVFLFAQYGNALVMSPTMVVDAFSKVVGWEPAPPPQPNVMGAQIAFTNVVLLLPLLMLARRWRLPVGTATVAYAVMAGLVAATTAVRHPSTLLLLLVAGVGVDALVAWLRPGDGSARRVQAFAALASFVTWTLFIAIASLTVGRLPAVVEFWTGVPVVMTLHGFIMGTLMAPHRVLAPAGGVSTSDTGTSDARPSC